MTACYAVYTFLTVLTAIPKVDTVLRHVRMGRWPVRSLLPFWGLFGQQFGIIDVGVYYRIGPNSAGDEWVRLTGGSDRPSTRWIWNPRLRRDHVGVGLAYRLIFTRKPEPPHRIRLLPSYQRILYRCRAAITNHIRSEDDGLWFSIEVSRGYWSMEPPRTLFISLREELE